LDDLGLVAALQWYVQEFEKHNSIHTEFVVEGDRSRLPSEYETVLFRISQEALTNIARHANASRVAVRLKVYPAQIDLTVEDNGRGFDPAEVLRGDRPHPGWGLLGVQERSLLLGGRYEIDSAPGRGTRIHVSIPLIVETKDAKNTVIAG
jgi:two-component system sensor histidine kinase UhpB